MPDSIEWICMDEAATAAKVSRATVYRWLRDGTIPADAVRYTPSGRPAIRRDAVEPRQLTKEQNRKAE